MAGVQEQDHGRDQFVLAQPSAVAFGDEKLADQIVAGIAATRARKSAHEIGECARRRGRALLDRAVHAELVHRDHPVRPFDERRPHLARNAEQVGDHGDGNGSGELGDQVGRALRRERVDPLVRQRGDPGPELFDPARDEGAIDEVAQPRVLGRLELEDRMALERVERRKMRLWLGPAQFRPAHQVRDLATEAAVAQQRRHIGVAGEAPEAVVLPEEHGRGCVDRGIGAIGIVEKAGVARVEPHAAPRGVYRWRHGRPYGKGRWKGIVIVRRGRAPVYRANRTKSDKILLIIRTRCYRARCRLILTGGTGRTRGGLASCSLT